MDEEDLRKGYLNERRDVRCLGKENNERCLLKEYCGKKEKVTEKKKLTMKMKLRRKGKYEEAECFVGRGYMK